MNLNNNIFLIIIGVIGLGLSLCSIGVIAFTTMLPGSRENLEHTKEMMNIAGWSTIFSVAMIAFGIYKSWRR